MFTKLFIKGQILLNDLVKDQRGVTAIEYGLIAAAIALVVGTAFGDTFTANLKSIFDKVAKAVETGAA